MDRDVRVNVKACSIFGYVGDMSNAARCIDVVGRCGWDSGPGIDVVGTDMLSYINFMDCIK